MDRRQFIKYSTGLSLLATLPAYGKKNDKISPIHKSKSEWKELLPPDRFGVLFEDNTEPAGSSELIQEKRKGTFICAACFSPLFKSSHKIDKVNDWPSFWATIPKAVRISRETKGLGREYRCAHCGGHQGYVFKDGPKPTRLRYSNNGLGLAFVSATGVLPKPRQ